MSNETQGRHPPNERTEHVRPAGAIDLPALQLPAADRERGTGDEFLTDLLQAAKTVTQHLATTARVVPRSRMGRLERAILVGHMVRLYKLYDTFCLLITSKRTEPANIMLRCIIDTSISLEYLSRFGNPSLYDEFVKASLWYEKRFRDLLEGLVQSPPLPIEARMLRSVERVFERAGYSPSDSFRKTWGPKTPEKAKALGKDMAYEFVYRPASHAVHGTWHDLEFHHLGEEGGDLRPALSYTAPRPQAIEGATVMALEAAAWYLQKIGSDPAGHLADRLRLLADWFHRMADAHEEYLASRDEAGTNQD